MIVMHNMGSVIQIIDCFSKIASFWWCHSDNIKQKANDIVDEIICR